VTARRRKRMPRLATALLLATTSLASQATTAAERTLQLPEDGVALKASPLPGYLKAQAYCVMCHSAEYMLYQPPSAARPYWEAMVRRMKQVFAAPFDESEIPDLVDYLVKTYGNEQSR
jgi:hypothetical protein